MTLIEIFLAKKIKDMLMIILVKIIYSKKINKKCLLKK